MRTLIIETSTERGIIALAENEMILKSKELPFGYNQSKALMPELFSMLGSEKPNLDCIGVGIGPGSYTGIRIGVAVAKILAYAWKLPLIGVCSLKAFIPHHFQQRFTALIDAKIGGVYVLKGEKNGANLIYPEAPRVCSLIELGDYLEAESVLATPFCEALKNKIDRLYPHATWQWQEVSPSALSLNLEIQSKYLHKEWSLEGQIELLYLRKTEAEIQREKNQVIDKELKNLQ